MFGGVFSPAEFGAWNSLAARDCGALTPGMCSTLPRCFFRRHADVRLAQASTIALECRARYRQTVSLCLRQRRGFRARRWPCLNPSRARAARATGLLECEFVPAFLLFPNPQPITPPVRSQGNVSFDASLADMMANRSSNAAMVTAPKSCTRPVSRSINSWCGIRAWGATALPCA